MVRVLPGLGWTGDGLSYFYPAACLALQLPFLTISESMGNHDSKIVGAGSVD
jgi:hypothetical protein